MSWIQRLYETYNRCAGLEQFDGAPLMPVYHTEQQTHLEIVLDGAGNFRRADVVPKETIFIPATEDSAGRTSGPIAHPLVDKLQYVAADYKNFGGEKDSHHALYMKELQAWAEAEPNPDVQAVLQYVGHGTVIADLVRAGLLPCDGAGKLITEWPLENGTPPPLFKLLTAKSGKRDAGDAFVRWSVERPGKPGSNLWTDGEVQSSWARIVSNWEGQRSLCMATGEELVPAVSHPKRLRHGADGAKLISSNDTSGYTFRGRFDSRCQLLPSGQCNARFQVGPLLETRIGDFSTTDED